MREWFEIKVRAVLGPDPADDKEVKCKYQPFDFVHVLVGNLL